MSTNKKLMTIWHSECQQKQIDHNEICFLNFSRHSDTMKIENLKNYECQSKQSKSLNQVEIF